MRRAQRVWRVAAALVGVWACGCSSDASWGTTGQISPPTSTDPGFKGGGPVPDNRQMLCPDVGGFGGTNITLTGGKSGSDAAPGVAGTSGGTGATSGVGGAGSEAGGVSSDAGRSGESGGTRLSCPSTPPIEEQQRACDAPGVCPYPDGTACRCEACAGGWCWSCSVAELPFGCPRLPPKTGESCPWTGVLCPYDTCGPWNTTSLAGCCLGEWHVSVRPCVSTL